MRPSKHRSMVFFSWRRNPVVACCRTNDLLPLSTIHPPTLVMLIDLGSLGTCGLQRHHILLHLSASGLLSLRILLHPSARSLLSRIRMHRRAPGFMGDCHHPSASGLQSDVIPHPRVSVLQSLVCVVALVVMGMSVLALEAVCAAGAHLEVKTVALPPL
jgi:hypothetical protein